MTPELITTIVTALITGVFTGGLTFVITSRKQKRDHLTNVIETYNKDNERLRLENEDIRSELTKEKDKRHEIENQFLFFRIAHHDIPFPMWYKGVHGDILYVNDAYEREFLQPQGKTKNDFIGKTDVDLWGEKIGKLHQQRDREAISMSRIFVALAPIEFPNQEMIAKQWIIIKYRLKLGEAIVGIVGMCIPFEKRVVIEYLTKLGYDVVSE